ncbi:MAG: hypothetical protein JRI59_01990 [Deltaproteobacteria bacterium]|nr:hypothetical protein [Deltaproteobacteria bacterium]
MDTCWQVVAFPLILPWREEFWTLPLYFAELKVGVLSGWPQALPYKGRPLPPEAQAPGEELQHFRPGELLQRKAFKDFLESREEVEDIIRELKGLPREEPRVELPSREAWNLAWQLEKMQAEEEARMLQVDRGEQWLAEILSPEPWDQGAGFSPAGITEMMDPELARLRYLLWRREMAPYLKDKWAPLLLGRTSRAIFGALKGWPHWSLIKSVKVQLPGVRSEEECWQAGGQEGPSWREGFLRHLEACLEVSGELSSLQNRAKELENFLEETVLPAWPGEPEWLFELEIWAEEEEEEDWGPVLCWAGAGAGILPG